MKKLLAVALGMVAASALADREITGDVLITTTQTISEKVTGNGRFIIGNGATLKLSHSYNTFTGGILVSNGVVQAEASCCMGTGDIVFANKAKSGDPGYVDSDRYNRQVYLYNSGGVWSNDFVFLDKDVHSSFPGIRAWKNAKLAGNITTPDSSRTIILSVDSGCTLTVEGDITTPTLWDIAKGRLVLKGKVTATTFQHGSSSDQDGTLELWNPRNEIRNFTMKMGSVECKAANVLYGAKVTWNINSWYMSGVSSQIRMNGYDQAVAGLYDATEAQYKNRITLTDKTMSVITPGDKPATLYIIGTSDNWWASTCARVFGPVDIVGNRAEKGYACIPRFNWFASPTTGTLATTNVSFVIRNGATFPNATAMVAAKGGTFELSAVTNTLTGLKRIDIAGKIDCSAACVEPIKAPQATMTLASDAVLKFGAGVTNTVKYLVINGQYQEPGIYTKANLPQMNVSGSVSDATAALVVLRKPHGLIMLLK